MSVLAALQIGGSIIKGIAGYKAGQKNAVALQAAAQDELNSGADAEAQIRDQARRVIGQQAASQFSNGFVGGTGSAIDTLAESQINATLDALRVRRTSALRAENYRQQASAAKREGGFSLISGILQGITTGAQQAEDWAAARSGQSAPQRGPGIS